MTVKAYAAMAAGKPLEPFEYEPVQRIDDCLTLC